MCSNKINSIINIDLHIHSIYSAYKEEKGYVDDSNEENIDILLEKLNENNINLFSITDHNNFNFHLYELLKEKKVVLIILMLLIFYQVLNLTCYLKKVKNHVIS